MIAFSPMRKTMGKDEELPVADVSELLLESLG